MVNKLRKPSLYVLAIFGLVLLYGASVSSARVQEEAEIKYASILGDYEFDMSSLGLGTITITFYVEEGELLVATETSSAPGKLEPIQGKEFAFIVEDPDEGTYQITFLKDDTGKYTKCHIANESMDINVTGNKI